MALEKIKSERTLKALKPGAGRINDGGGLYLVPFAWGESHYWRMDYTVSVRRSTYGAIASYGLSSGTATGAGVSDFVGACQLCGSNVARSLFSSVGRRSKTSLR